MAKGKFWRWVEAKMGLDEDAGKAKQVGQVFVRSHQEALEGGVGFFTGVELDLNDGYEYKDQVAQAFGSDALAQAGEASDAAFSGQGGDQLASYGQAAGLDEYAQAAQVASEYAQLGGQAASQAPVELGQYGPVVLTGAQMTRLLAEYQAGGGQMLDAVKAAHEQGRTIKADEDAQRVWAVFQASKGM